MKSIPPTIKSMLSVFLFLFLSPVIHSTAQEIQKPAEIKKEVESKNPKGSEQPKNSVQPAPLKPPAPAALPVPITDRLRSALVMA